ncbi:SusC/RagA family TonB-linked outer membrane protein [Filimonas effusa]|uniref:TonB-dependent receptor n=1 Tax=Filimonas effusa TaxID=2508721 RepID=A0A4Q1D9A1_9BACT|nr:TonB-dependent receptor [Filimonas effusa]RXK85408.1 TonB-dependent receptor [Filimonas effusa]
MKYSFKIHKRIALLLGCCLLFSGIKSQESSIRVAGKVTNEKGAPIEAASVTIAGSQTGTTTNAEGRFTLNARSGVLLFITYIGYDTLKVKAAAEINVALVPVSAALEDVIVVGYGRQRRTDVTGSISSVSPKDFNQGVTASPDQLLTGKVAGLTIVRNSGDPTGGATIQLRGPSSLTAGINPFYVIDGVPGANIDLIAPADIVSMDILKDASSAAIYGSRAANGVIMVTTKKGKSGKPVVAYSGYAALDAISKRVEVLGADEYTKFLADNNMTVSASESGHNTNWQNEIFRNGISHNHNISIAGGNSDTRFSASVNYFEQEGIVKKNDIKRLVTRLGVEQSLFDNKVRASLNVVTSNIRSHHVDYGIFNYAARFLPVSPIKSDAAEYEQYGGYFQVPGRTNYYNPVAWLNQREEPRTRNIFQTFGKIEADLTRDLMFVVTGSVQREMYDNKTYMSIYNINPTAIGKGYANRTVYTNSDKVFESNLTYTAPFTDEQKLKLMVGYSYQNTITNDGLYGQNNTFSSDGLGPNNLGAGGGASAGLINPFDGTPAKQESTLLAYFGRVNYAWADRYLLTATVRRDGSSKFGKNNRWALFPSVSVAWKITQENFMKDQRLFNDLKLRMGYGVSGNQNISPYASLTQYGTGSDQFLYNGSFINSLAVTQNPNPNLKWETTKMYNFGLDFTVLKGRLSGTVEYYDKKTSDLLYSYNVPTPPYLFNTLLANGGTMSNKGIEVSLNATVITTAHFTWKSFGNFARNKNKVGSISGNIANLNLERVLTGGDYFAGFDGWTAQTTSVLLPGQPIGTFFTAKYVGYDAAAKKTIYQTPSGKLKTSDQLESPGDYQIVGYALPKFTYGWGNSFTYKGFDLAFFVRGVYGNKIYNASRADLSRLTQAGVTNVSPLAVKDGVFEAPVNSSRWLESGSFLRMDNATLGYNVPVKKGNVFKSLRFYFTGTNVFTITEYTGVDPEVNMGGLAPGVDSRNYYPKTRSFIFGVDVRL